MAEIKTLLKEARKMIDEKNFKEAQECCKNILRKDKQNYLGLILLGKSLQDSDQAPLAYQKAISIKADHPLAWQGLASYYERKDDDASKLKLLNIYDEILKLTIDEEKSLEIVNKLGHLGCVLKNNEVITTLINYISKELNDILYNTAEYQLLQIIKSDIKYKQDDIPRIIQFITNLKEYHNDDNLYILQGKAILQKSNFVDAVEDVINLDVFSKSVILREWFCKYLCTHFVQNNSFSDLDVDKIYNVVTAGIENSKYPKLLNCMVLYSKRLFLDAYTQCVPLINFHEADCTEATFIISCTNMLKKWSVTQKLATNFLLKTKNPDFSVTLKKTLFLSLTEQQMWQQALNVAKDIAYNNLDVNERAALARCYIELNQNAQDILENLQSTEYFNQLQVLTLMKENKFNEVINLLENSSETTFNLFNRGKAYWELKQYEKSLGFFLKAAKLDSEHADTFNYLGMFYYHYKHDYEKSKKCFEKAYSLKNSDTDIVKNLSTVYNKLQLKEEDFALLSTAIHNLENNTTWINFRLGLHYLRKREWENSIIKFRDVIKSNCNDAIAFECLADAYFSRGSFTSALKAYNKVMVMDPNKQSHCLTKIGYIHSLLTQYEDAISTFEKVFQFDPDSLLNLKGIAEVWIRVAKKKLMSKLYGSARDAAQNAINYLSKALSVEKKLMSFWNLLADALMFVTKLPTQFSYIYMKNIITDNSHEIIKKESLDIFPQALACYSLIAKHKQQVASYDLASTYLAYYHASKNTINCHISYKLIIICIKMKPSSWRNWNILGKICIYLKKYALAQHCFIKALIATRKWSIAKIWCNLGTLYVKMKLYKLANYCFWRGQSTLPSYPQSWIGQALIAEAIREEEAMDLFRHACRLGFHPESALGYADWVCRTLNNSKYIDNLEMKYVIDGLYAVPYAIDLVIWLLSFEPNNACANTILGLLQERSGLLRSALLSYEKALNFVEDNNKNIVLLNLGRIYVRLEKYDEAIKTYKAITEGSLNSTCGLALALFKINDYKEAYSVYDTALQWLCNEDEEKADLLVAMAGIFYMLEGMDNVKTLLFRSIQVSQKKPTAYSLFAICSFGIIHSDQSLSKLALSELSKYDKDNKFGFDIGFLKSYLLFKEDLCQAIKILTESLHDHPNNAMLWFCLAQYCLSLPNIKAKTASCSARRAMCSQNINEYNLHPAKMLSTASIAEHIGGKRMTATILAKKAVHMYPLHSDSWAALIFTTITSSNLKEYKDWILKTTNHMRKHLNMPRNLSRWVNLVEKKIIQQSSS